MKLANNISGPEAEIAKEAEMAKLKNATAGSVSV
jgi:hypothetical protein